MDTGILIAVIKSIQQMKQYSTLWVTFGITSERLKYENYLFLSADCLCKNLSEPDSLIAPVGPVKGHANWPNDTLRLWIPIKSEAE